MTARTPFRIALMTATVCLATLISVRPVKADLNVELVETAERAEAARIAMIERVAPAVVSIFDEHQRGGGSGVLIDQDGYGLTNYHVVAGMLESRKGLGGLPDGNLYELQVLGIDPGGDVAMFKLDGPPEFPHVGLADSDKVSVGDTAIAMGNPFMLSDDFTPTVTMGIVSGIHRYQWGSGDTLLYSDCIQVDAPINPGNSGGPLFNTDGDLIGVNGRISVSMRGRVNVGMGYAITTNQIKTFMPGLLAGLLTEHGTIQAIVRDQPDGSVVFVELLEDGPAWNIGIRPGDRLRRFAGRPIESANQFASILGTLPGDWPVGVSYQKPGGKTTHRQARTEPIKLEHSDHFEPDEAINQATLQRLLDRARKAAGLAGQGTRSRLQWRWTETHQDALDGSVTLYECHDDGTGPIVLQSATGDLPDIRITEDRALDRRPSGDQPLPVELDLLYRSLFHLHRTIFNPNLPARATALRHIGAGNLLAMDDDGETSSTLLECVALPIGEHAEARYEFDAESARLRRIVTIDLPTQDFVRVTVDAADAWPIKMKVDGNRHDFTIARRFHGPVPFAKTSPSNRPAAEGASLSALLRRESVKKTIDDVSRRVVKLVGTRVGRNPGYGSGIIVSPDGLVLTVDSALLDASNIRAVLQDGSRHYVDLVFSDRTMQLALLRLRAPPGSRKADSNDTDQDPETAETVPLPHFELSDNLTLDIGQWVIAAGNPFKVASGAERISVALGVYGGRVKLDATRGTQDYPYRGEVVILDAVTSTPGFPGGAVVDLQGRLVGMVGRVVESRLTHTMVNHAIPADVLTNFVNNALDRGSAGQTIADLDVEKARESVYHGMKFFELGYLSNPVYVDRVKRGSPAAHAGVRKDDLIVGANGRPVPTLDALNRIIQDCKPGDTLELTLMRKDKLHKLNIPLEASP